MASNLPLSLKKVIEQKTEEMKKFVLEKSYYSTIS